MLDPGWGEGAEFSTGGQAPSLPAGAVYTVPVHSLIIYSKQTLKYSDTNIISLQKQILRNVPEN